MMGGCNFYKLVNTGTTSDTVTFSDCDGSGLCNLEIKSGETVYVNSNTTLTSPEGAFGLIGVYDSALTNQYYNFSGACSGETFSFGSNNITTTAFTLSKFYCLSGVTHCTGEPPFSGVQDCYKVVSITPSYTYQLVSIIPFQIGEFNTQGECLTVCPCAIDLTPTPTPTMTETPTPTPTMTETPTPTPTPTQTPFCSNYYCITNTGYDYDDNYNVGGTHNGKLYWTGETNVYLIYYNSGNTQWCLSMLLDGPCFLFGKTPCTSFCPDLCDEYLYTGICPTPTPTPTINCDVLDFQAIFNCDVTLTPTNTPSPTQTPTLTPTPSPTEPCGYLDLVATVFAYSPTPTQTPTQTPTPSLSVNRPINFIGDVKFNTIDSFIQCPESKKFQDCYTGFIYYTTNLITLPNGGSLEQFMIFKASVDGEIRCISYLGIDNNIIGANQITLLEGPVGFSNLGECAFCSTEITKTPTPTPTMTPTQTPTLTPTPTNLPDCNCYEIVNYTQSKTGSITVMGIQLCNPQIPLTQIWSIPNTPSSEYPLYVCSPIKPIVITPQEDVVITQVASNCNECCKCYVLSGNTVTTGTTYQYMDCNYNLQVVSVPPGNTIKVCASVFPSDYLSTQPNQVNRGYIFTDSGTLPFLPCVGSPKECPS